MKNVASVEFSSQTSKTSKRERFRSRSRSSKVTRSAEDAFDPMWGPIRCNESFHGSTYQSCDSGPGGPDFHVISQVGAAYSTAYSGGHEFATAYGVPSNSATSVTASTNADVAEQRARPGRATVASRSFIGRSADIR